MGCGQSKVPETVGRQRVDIPADDNSIGEQSRSVNSPAGSTKSPTNGIFRNSDQFVSFIDEDFETESTSTAAVALRKRGNDLYRACFDKSSGIATMLKVDRAKDAIKVYTEAAKTAQDQQDPAEWLSSTKNKGVASFHMASYVEFRKRNTDQMVMYYYQLAIESLCEVYHHSRGLKAQAWIDDLCSNIYATVEAATIYAFSLSDKWEKRYSLLEGLIPVRDKKTALATSLIYIAISNEVLKIVEAADDSDDWRKSLSMISEMYRPLELAKTASAMMQQESPSAARIKNDIFFLETARNKYQLRSEMLQRRAANAAEAEKLAAIPAGPTRVQTPTMPSSGQLVPTRPTDMVPAPSRIGAGQPASELVPARPTDMVPAPSRMGSADQPANELVPARPTDMVPVSSRMGASGSEGDHLIPDRSALPPPPQSIGSNGELVRAAPSEIATRSATTVEPLPVRMGSSEEGNNFMLGGATPMNVSMVVPLPGVGQIPFGPSPRGGFDLPSLSPPLVGLSIPRPIGPGAAKRAAT